MKKMFNWTNLLRGNNRSKEEKGTSRPMDRNRTGIHSLDPRRLRMEELETRTLLAVTALEYADIAQTYADFNLSSNQDDLNIIELTSAELTATALKTAVSQAAGSDSDDLIVIRTEASLNAIQFGDDALTLNLSEGNGSITIIGYGEKSLELVGHNEGFIQVLGGNVNFGGITFVGQNGQDADLSPRDLLYVADGADVARSRILYLTRDTLPASGPLTTSGLDDTTSEDQSYSIEFNLTGSKWVYQTGLTAAQAAEFQINITSASEEYYVGVFYDANKDWNNDDELCWAASTADVLTYTGWARQQLGFNNETDVFNYYKDNFTNASGNIYFGIDWFLSGNYAPQGFPGWSQIKQDGGGAFYPDVNFDDVCQQYDGEVYGSLLVNAIDDSLRNSCGVGIGLGWYTSPDEDDRLGGHGITLWGYVYDTDYSKEDTNYYTGLIVTDSDDDVYKTQHYAISWDAAYGWYHFDGYGPGNGYLESFTVLDSYQSNFQQQAPILSYTAKDDAVVLYWKPDTHSAGYTLEYKESSSSTWTPITITNKETYTFAIEGLTNNTDYDIRIKSLSTGLYLESDWYQTTVTTKGLTGLPEGFAEKYAEFNYKDTDLNNANITYLAAFSVDGIKALIQQAATTEEDDIIILDTSLSDAVQYEFVYDSIQIDFDSSVWGSVTIIGCEATDVNGKAMTIDGNKKTRVFETGNKVILNLGNIELTNGYINAITNGELENEINNDGDDFHAYGGAILNRGNLTVVSGTFTENEVYAPASETEDQATVADGGAIFNTGSARVFKTTFTGNIATTRESGTKVLAQGGAVYTLGFFSAFDSTFTANTATGIYNTGYGGAINVGDGGTASSIGEAVLTESHFTENSAAFGAVGYVSTGKLTFNNCIVTENSSTSAFVVAFIGGYGYTTGAGIIHNNEGVITVTDTKIYGNSGTGIGGRHFDSGTVSVLRCEIYENDYDGIFHSGSVLTVTDSIFYGNKTGIYNNGDKLVIENCAFFNQRHSGIYTNAEDYLSITNSVIRDNTRSGMFLRDGNTPILDIYASGIINSGANQEFCLIKETDIFNNISSSENRPNTFSYGGGIYNSGKLEFQNCEIHDNVAGGYASNASTSAYGGGVYNTGDISFLDCLMNQNKVENTFVGSSDCYTYGGAIYNNGTLTLDTIEMKYNLCYVNCKAGRDNPASLSYGAGIYNGANGEMNIQRVYLRKNAVYNTSDFHISYGSGIYNAGSGTVANTFITEHGNFISRTTDYGSGIYNSGTLALTNVEISKNFSNNTGTGVYNSGTLTGRNITISGNSSSSTTDGNGIYNGGTTTLQNSIVAGNWSTGRSQISGNAPTLSNSLVGTTTEELRSVFVVTPTYNTDGSIQNYEAIDLHLTSEAVLNPAIDTGSNTDVVAGELDLDNLSRIYNEIVDIGCYEYGSTQPGKLTTPTITSAVLIGQTDVRLTWNTIPNADHYIVKYSAGGDNWTSRSVDETSITITGLTGGTVYTFTVTAVSDDPQYPDSDPSAPVTVTTGKLSTPTNVVAEPAASSVTITWDAVEDAASYTLRYSSDRVNWTLIRGITKTSYTVNGLSPTQTYYFTVQAIAEPGYADSDQSVIVSASPGQLPVPKNFTPYADTKTSFVVTWDSVGHAASYLLKYRQDGTSEWTSVSVTETSYTLDGTESGAKYWFTITAIADSGYKSSSESAEISAQWRRYTVVNTLLDETEDNDTISLREAIFYAGMEISGGTTITFDESLAGGTIQLTLGELVIDKTLTIDAMTLLDSGGLTIDAQGASRVFNVSGETADVTFIGLTVTGGQAPVLTEGGSAAYGGGIFSSAKSLSLQYCIVTNNMASATLDVNGTGNASAQGGGIYATGRLNVEWSEISDNIAQASTINKKIAYRAEAFGGGIYASDIVMTHSTVSGNMANAVSNENYAIVKGGGLFVSGSIVNSLITLNTAEATSGLQYFSTEVYAMSFGGGICQSGNLVITNSTVAKNSSWASRSKDKQYYSFGGGICALSSTYAVTVNNSIVLLNNTSYIQKLTDYYLFDDYDICFYHTSDEFVSSIVGHNNVSTYREWAVNSSDNVTIDYTSVVTEYGSLQNFLDHFFKDVYDPFETTVETRHEDYHIRNSAIWAVNMGNNFLAVEADGSAIEKDFGGADRIYDNIVDIGAYEIISPLVVTTNLDIVDPDDDETSLREAILYANALDEPGTIRFLDKLGGTTIELKSDPGYGTLVITKSVTIDAQNLLTKEGSPALTIDGSLLDDRMFDIASTAEAVSVNGLIFANGHTAENGAAIRSEGMLLQLNVCHFLNNSADGDGGAVWTAGNLTVSNASFLSNSALGNGGAAWTGQVFRASDSVFTENTASGSGGAVYSIGQFTAEEGAFRNNEALSGGSVYAAADASVNDVIFEDNKSVGNGGALYVTGELTSQDASFTQNTAEYGGAVYLDGSAILTDSVFTNNSASVDGGGLYATGNVEIVGGSFRSNSAQYSGGAMNTLGVIKADGVRFLSNSAKNDGGAVYLRNITVFCNTVFSGNTASGLGGGLFVYAGVTKVINSQINDNDANEGGGIYLGTYSELIARNITLTANRGTGLFVETDSTADLYNSILAINDKDVISNGTVNAHAVLSGYTDWTNKSDSLWWEYDSLIPLFANLDDDGLYQLSARAFQAIDMGINGEAVDSEGNPLTVDLVGNPRIVKATNMDPATVDLGACEYPFVADSMIQYVYGAEDVYKVSPGDDLSVSVYHEVLKHEGDHNATTLSLRIHFDSNFFNFDSSNPGIYEKSDLTGQGNFIVYTDSENYDGDLSTDSYLLVTWNNQNGLWNGNALREIFRSLNFQVRSGLDLTQDYQSVIRFSAKNITANYVFISTPIEVQINRVNYDIDGDGVVNISTDVNLLLRYMAGKRGSDLTDNLTYSASPRSAEKIEAYIAAYASIFDIDGDGAFYAHVDGDLLTRYLAGFRGDALVSGINLTGGTRTDAASIQSFIEQYLTGVFEATPTTENAHVITTKTDMTVIAGETLTVNLAHTLQPNDANLIGTTLSLRVYYDSDFFAWNGSANYDKLGVVGPSGQAIILTSDLLDEDGDTTTDSYLQITWNIESGWTWSSQKINDLLRLVLTVKDQTAAFVDDNLVTTLRITSLDRTAGFKMDDVEVNVTVLPTHFANDLWAFDIDGNGVVDIATDGNLLLRYKIFGNVMNTEDLLTGGSTRRGEDIIDYLNKFSSLFDIDGDGIVKLDTDVNYFLKFFADYRGDALIGTNVSVKAIRTTGEELADYIKRFIPESQRTDPTPAGSSLALPEATAPFAEAASETVAVAVKDYDDLLTIPTATKTSLTVTVAESTLPIIVDGNHASSRISAPSVFRCATESIRQAEERKVSPVMIWEDLPAGDFDDDFVNDETVTLYQSGAEETMDETDAIFGDFRFDLL